MGSLDLSILLTIGVFLVFFSSPVSAFGAGNIINISSVEGSNYRHGDIEDTLLQLLISIAHNRKFDDLSVKRVYFGNWLRDYSQAIDVGGLKQLPAETLRLLISVLGFMTFGYATKEFQVTSERLGCYRPEEHIDNPRDYADNLDARQYDPRLRAPCNEQNEISVDWGNAMKLYIASEGRGIDTSAGFVRKCFEKSIELGRKHYRENNDDDFYEALRLLGTGSHTLEDFAAHSNYVELVLRELGVDAYPHTGAKTECQTNGKTLWPIVTGTFGMIDFIHSVVGEVSDKMAQSATQELDTKMINAENDQGSTSVLKAVFNKVPWNMISGGGGDQNDFGSQMDDIQNNALSKKMENQANIQQKKIGGYDVVELQKQAEEAFAQVYPILEFHDRIMKTVVQALDMIPGLSETIETLTGALQIFVFSMMAPFIKPILGQVRDLLGIGSKGVLASSEAAQFRVFDDELCSDPTHSVLSKDHFTNILNNPAGKVASTIVSFVAPLIVECWENPEKDANATIDNILKVLHHPALRDENHVGQTRMFATVQKWWEEKPRRQQQELREALSKEGVRAGKNHTGEDPSIAGGHSHAGGSGRVQYEPVPLNHSQEPGIGAVGNVLGNAFLGSMAVAQGAQEKSDLSDMYTPDRQQGIQQHGSSGFEGGHQGRPGRNDDDATSYGGRTSGYNGGNSYENQGRNNYNNEQRYGGRQNDLESRHDQLSYGRNNDDEAPYNRNTRNQEESEETTSYGQRQRNDDQETPSYGRQQEHSYGRNNADETPSYERQGQSGYRQQQNDDETPAYGRSHRNNDGGDETQSYGRSHRQDDEEPPSRRRNEQDVYGQSNEQSYGRNQYQSNEDGSSGERGHGRRHNEEEEGNYGRSNEGEEYGNRRRRQDEDDGGYNGGNRSNRYGQNE